MVLITTGDSSNTVKCVVDVVLVCWCAAVCKKELLLEGRLRHNSKCVFHKPECMSFLAQIRVVGLSKLN